MAIIRGLFSGKIRTFEPSGERTGIYKSAVAAAKVGKLGLEGDQQADKRYHGGLEKALHQFSRRAYETITTEFPSLHSAALPGSFGENLSSDSLNDTNVFIGDIYRIKNVVLQVSEPRKPCWKINRKFDTEQLSVFVEQQRITGWYYRVLEEGELHVGDEMRLEERFNEDASIAKFTRVMTQHRPAMEDINDLLACDGLSPLWNKRLLDRQQFLSNLEN